MNDALSVTRHVFDDEQQENAMARSESMGDGSGSVSGSLGIAMVGYAFMGRAHSQGWRTLPAFFDVPAFRRQVIVGRDQGRVAAAASALGWAESSTDWCSVMERDDIDIVDICAPGALHAQIAVAALEAGKHVLVEKPLANSLAEAETLAAAASAHPGQVAVVNFNYRRVPAIALARQLIAEGKLGMIHHVRASYLQDWLNDPSTPMSWRLRKPEAGSGALGDLGSHLTDLVLHLTGEEVLSLTGGLRTFIPERPAGDSGSGSIKGSSSTDGAGSSLEPVTVDDAAWATLQLSGGGIAQLEVTRVALGRKNGLRLEIYGERGSIAFDLERLNELEFFDGAAPAGRQGFSRILVTEADHPYVGAWWPDGHIIGWEHTFTHQFAELLRAVDGQQAASPSFADGLRVQRVLDAIERSSIDGRSISLV